MTYKCHKSCFRIKFNHRKWQWEGLVVLTRGNADGCFKETAKQVVSVKRAQEVVPSAFLGLISNLDRSGVMVRDSLPLDLVSHLKTFKCETGNTEHAA